MIRHWLQTKKSLVKQIEDQQKRLDAQADDLASLYRYRRGETSFVGHREYPVGSVNFR